MVIMLVKKLLRAPAKMQLRVPVKKGPRAPAKMLDGEEKKERRN